MNNGPMRLKLLACEVLYREACAVIARSRNRVDLEFLPQGLHNLGSLVMREKLQAAVDAAGKTEYDAILLGYALCGNGLIGLKANSAPIVVPRAHDCITLFLGSKERYMEYFSSHPGIYFRTSGWIERISSEDGCGVLAPVDQISGGMRYDDLVARFGEEDARYILEELSPKPRFYDRITYIHMGMEPDNRFEERARREAEEKGWKFERISGDLSLMQGLVDGPWDESRYLTVAPGEKVANVYSAEIIKAIS